MYSNWFQNIVYEYMYTIKKKEREKYVKMSFYRVIFVEKKEISFTDT